MLKVIVGPSDGYVEAEIASNRKEGKKVVVISSEHGFDPLELASIAKINALDPKFILSGVYVSRAFNVFQAEKLISELGPEKANSLHASLLVAIDVHTLFLDEGISIKGLKRFSHCMSELKRRSSNLRCLFVFKSTLVRGTSSLVKEASLQADELATFNYSGENCRNFRTNPLPLSSDPPSLGGFSSVD